MLSKKSLAELTLICGLCITPDLAFSEKRIPEGTYMPKHTLTESIAHSSKHTLESFLEEIKEKEFSMLVFGETHEIPEQIIFAKKVLETIKPKVKLFLDEGINWIDKEGVFASYFHPDEKITHIFDIPYASFNPLSFQRNKDGKELSKIMDDLNKGEILVAYMGAVHAHSFVYSDKSLTDFLKKTKNTENTELQMEDLRKRSPKDQKIFASCLEKGRYPTLDTYKDTVFCLMLEKRILDTDREPNYIYKLKDNLYLQITNRWK